MPADDILLDAEERMEKAVDVFRHALTGIRTGRANPGLVDSLRAPTPLALRLAEHAARGLAALERGGHSRLADLFAFRALRDRLGFSRLRSAATGGAALGPDTFRFFQAMGVPMRQLYGQTELLGAYTLHRPGEVDFDTVGVPFNADIELQVKEPDVNGVGEIVTRHPNMFLGYHGMADTGDVRDGCGGALGGRGQRGKQKRGKQQ